MHNCCKCSITVTRNSLFCLSGLRLSVQIPSWTYCFNLLTSLFYLYLIITQSHNKLVRCSKSTKPKFLSRRMWLTGQCDGNDGVLPSGHSQNSTAGWVDGKFYTWLLLLVGECMFAVLFIYYYHFTVHYRFHSVIVCFTVLVFQWTRAESPNPLLSFWQRLQKRRACKLSTLL